MHCSISSSIARVIVPAFVLALGLGTPARADDVFNACSKNTTSKLRPSSVVVNGSAACKATETPRTWNQNAPSSFSCHIEEYDGTALANTFAVLNSTCSSGKLTGTGAIWHTPFDAADNGPFYVFPRTDVMSTLIPYNHTGVAQDFRFVLTCCS